MHFIIMICLRETTHSTHIYAFFKCFTLNTPKSSYLLTDHLKSKPSQHRRERMNKRTSERVNEQTRAPDSLRLPKLPNPKAAMGKNPIKMVHLFRYKSL